jgi:hypothetical protein
MKHLLTGLIFLTWGYTAQAQTWETGLAINKTYLWQSNSGVDGVDRTEGLGISAMARYQRPKSFFLFRNNEAGLEFSHGGIYIQEHTSPGGAGGGITNIKYNTTSFTLNNYFVNFGTLNKGFQVAMGFHYNYKLVSHSDGYYMRRNARWDTLGLHYWFEKTYYPLDGKNNPEIHRFNFGPTVGIAFRPFQVGKINLRCRYDISSTIGRELQSGIMGFSNLRQRFALSFVWADLKSNRSLEKFKAEK